MSRPQVKPCGDPQDDWADRLAHVIKSDVIPKLLAANARLWVADPTVPTIADARELTRLLHHDDPQAASDFTMEIVNRGVPAERGLVDLFVPAANLIGEMWANDECTFADVTIVVSRLHLFVRHLGAFIQPPRLRGPVRHLAVLSTAPDEQHDFGLALVEQFLVSTGLDVLWTTPSNVVEFVKQHFVHVLGFTASCEDRIEALASLVTEVRSVSKNPGVVVMIGGRCFIDHPELALRFDANAMVASSLDTATTVRRLVAALNLPDA